MRTRWLLSLGVVVLLAVAAVAIAARGGDDEQSARPAGTNLNAILCPLEQTGSSAEGEPQFGPAKDAFDTSELIGLKLADAEAKAQENGCAVVVSLSDGVGLQVPIDIDPTRIYVYIENDVVTQIEGVGGGL